MHCDCVTSLATTRNRLFASSTLQLFTMTFNITPVFVFALAFGLLNVFQSKIGDGFPLGSTETMEIRNMVVALNVTQHDGSDEVFYRFCFAYLIRQMFPISGTYGMNLIAGALYGPIIGYVLCISLTALAATLSYGATYAFMFFFLHADLYTQDPTLPLLVNTLLNVQVNGFSVWSKLSLSLTRSPKDWLEFCDQLFTLATVRMFNLVPDWFVHAFLASVQYPMDASVASAALAAAIHSLLPVLLGPHLDGIESVYAIWDWYSSLFLITFSALAIGSIAFKVMQRKFDEESVAVHQSRQSQQSNRKLRYNIEPTAVQPTQQTVISAPVAEQHLCSTPNQQDAFHPDVGPEAITAPQSYTDGQPTIVQMADGKLTDANVSQTEADHHQPLVSQPTEPTQNQPVKQHAPINETPASSSIPKPPSPPPTASHMKPKPQQPLQVDQPPSDPASVEQQSTTSQNPQPQPKSDASQPK